MYSWNAGNIHRIHYQLIGYTLCIRIMRVRTQAYRLDTSVRCVCQSVIFYTPVKTYHVIRAHAHTGWTSRPPFVWSERGRVGSQSKYEDRNICENRIIGNTIIRNYGGVVSKFSKIDLSFEYNRKFIGYEYRQISLSSMLPQWSWKV